MLNLIVSTAHNKQHKHTTHPPTHPPVHSSAPIAPGPAVVEPSGHAMHPGGAAAAPAPVGGLGGIPDVEGLLSGSEPPLLAE